MLDYFDRLIKPGDLVVSKSTGRHSHMIHGIVQPNGNVRLASGSIGGASDQVIMDLSDPAMLRVYEELLDKFESIDTKKKLMKSRNSKTRIKEFTRFGVYSPLDGYSFEILLGPCTVTDRSHTVTYKNAWIKVGKKDYQKPMNVENAKVYDLISTYNGHMDMRVIRDCKAPTLHIESFIYKRETLEALLGKAVVLL